MLMALPICVSIYAHVVVERLALPSFPMEIDKEIRTDTYGISLKDQVDQRLARLSDIWEAVNPITTLPTAR